MKTRNIIAAATVLLGSAATAQQAPAIPQNAPPLVGSTVDQSQAQSSSMARMNQRALDEQLDAPGRSGRSGAVAAAAGDVRVQAAVRDSRGVAVGTVEAVDSEGAVVSASAGRVKVPFDAFGKDSDGLVLGITKKAFDRLVVAANAKAGG
jgi:hypothetical protein